MSGGAAVIQGDALNLQLPDESVDIIITSPPYFALRSYRDEGEHYEGQVGSEPTPQDFLEALWAATAEMKRVLKPSGSIFVNLGDKYAGSGGHNNSGISYARNKNGTGRSTLRGKVKAAADYEEKHELEADRRNAPNHYNRSAAFTTGEPRAKSLCGLPWRYAIGCIDDLGLILRAEMVWAKPNGLPESVTDRVRRSHEQWFHFTKEPRYFAAVDEIREPHAEVSLQRARRERYAPDLSQAGVGGPNTLNPEQACNPLGKLPGSVWEIATEPLKVPAHLDIDHFAAFPQEWPRRLILGWSPSGICVECGEGRRPVVDKEFVKRDDSRGASAGRRSLVEPDGRGPGGQSITSAGAPAGSTVATITGYACACPEPTGATRPAVVLDPFGGTGTVAMVARSLGRFGISVDLSRDYCRLARWRVFESGHAVKSRLKTEARCQGSLF